jgi:hypothetical protein
MKILLISIAVIMLGLVKVHAQDPAEPRVPGANEIVLIEKDAKGIRLVEIYAGADNEESRRRHLEWAKLYETNEAAGFKRFERFILFRLSTKKPNEGNRLVLELLKELATDRRDERPVIGMIPVYENRITLNGKSWLLVKKPLIIEEKRD